MKKKYFIKRIVDILISTIALVVLSPIFLFIFFIIKIEDPKVSAFYTQERLGKNGKVFKMYKFRTMKPNSENIRKVIFDKGEYVSEKDFVTKSGSILRKLSLDEIPQLVNILKGDMSLIGPRPTLTYHPYKYEDYPERYKKRFSILPGITGYAQVNGRNNLSWNERLELDIEYVDKYSLVLDIKIFFTTILKVFKKEGVYKEGNN